MKTGHPRVSLVLGGAVGEGADIGAGIGAGIGNDIGAAVEAAASRGFTVDVVTGQPLRDDLRARVHATGGQVTLVGTPAPAAPAPPPGLLPLPKFLAPRLGPLRRVQRDLHQLWRDLPVPDRVRVAPVVRLLPPPARFDLQVRADLDALRLLGRADALLALDGAAEPAVRWWVHRRPDVTPLPDVGSLSRWPEG